MLKLIDLLFFGFLLLCMFDIQLRSVKHGVQDDAFGLQQTTALRGALCILILFHHASLLIGSGLSVCVLKRVGAYVVGLFYALSGYGLMASWKKNGLRGFWRKRFCGTILPYLILSAAALATRLLVGEGLRPRAVLLSFVNGKPLIRYSWFILTILVYYVFFWLAALLAKKDPALLFALSGFFTFFSVFALQKLGFEEYWYNAAWGFPLGMLWQHRQQAIAAVFRRRPQIYLALSGVVTLWWIAIAEHFYWFGYLSRICATLSVCVFVFLLMFRLQSRNRILQFLGSISMEVYLIHGLVVTVLVRFLSPVGQPALFLLLLFPATILLAWLFHLGYSTVVCKKRPAQSRSSQL